MIYQVLKEERRPKVLVQIIKALLTENSQILSVQAKATRFKYNAILSFKIER